MNDTEPKPGDTAADLKMKIEKRQAEIGKELPEGKTPKADVIDSKSTEKPQPKSPETVKSETTQPLNGASNDAIEWAKKKGLETPEAIARQLREMEAEFHRRNQSKGKGWTEPLPESIAPQNGNVQRGNSYTPPPQARPYVPRQNLEQISKTYNIPTEDVERVLPLIMDAINAQKSPLEEKLAMIEKDNIRNSEFRNLMSDPTFSNPMVQAEMHRILGEHPEVFEREPEPFKWAYKESMVELARRNLQGPVPLQNSYVPSTRPPVTAGNVGSGTGDREVPENAMNRDKFNSLTIEEQRAYLKSVGAVERKYY